MKNKLLKPYDAFLMKKRSLIESVNNILKNTFHAEHSRYRSLTSLFINIFSALSVYTLSLKNPSIIPELNMIPLASVRVRSVQSYGCFPKLISIGFSG